MDNIEIRVDDDLHIIRVTCHGKINWSNAPDITNEARTLGAKKGYAILFDLRGAVIDEGTMGILTFVREIQAKKLENLRYVRSALLISSGSGQADWSFYETAARNAGINVRLFVDNEEEALKWAASSK